MPAQLTARRFTIHGRVQGVGYRNFAQRAAEKLNITGYARNLDDGSVEVYAIGTESQLSDFAGMLRKGPSFAGVRSVDREETALEKHAGFRIR